MHTSTLEQWWVKINKCIFLNVQKKKSVCQSLLILLLSEGTGKPPGRVWSFQFNLTQQPSCVMTVMASVMRWTLAHKLTLSGCKMVDKYFWVSQSLQNDSFHPQSNSRAAKPTFLASRTTEQLPQRYRQSLAFNAVSSSLRVLLILSDYGCIVEFGYSIAAQPCFQFRSMATCGVAAKNSPEVFFLQTTIINRDIWAPVYSLIKHPWADMVVWSLKT